MTIAVAKNVVVKSQYLELVRAFPPRIIRTAREYDATLAVIHKITAKGEEALTRDELDYLDAMEMLIDRYDDEHYPMLEDKRTPLERLQYVMEESGMSTADLGRLLGNRSLASQILLGRRQLSKVHIRKLADHFCLSTDYFLEGQL
ncbi:MAG: hypothetical protein FWD53_05435 [Phycisphaerales bacterium]|nr:hypothetical protein [Phycisphaerales bacterium]